jgi:tetratricopeptide (TPR) repeat protein
MEAQAYIDAGKLDDPSNTTLSDDVPPINDAIEAYQEALERNPDNAQAWAELARIQTYSSSMLRNDADRMKRMKEALESADKSVELEPDESTTHAIRAFVLDWYAFNSLLSDEQSQEYLIEAEHEATRAFQLDPENALALAFYAEILADQQKWLQAEKYASQAVAQDPNSMDTHRVFGYVLETLGQYNSAIQQYQRAAEITPNLTFLYVRIGQNFREGIRDPDRALEYFEKAANIDKQLGVENPVPYLEIARTYSQEGQFFAASLNAEEALALDPTRAHTYGQFGLIYRRARNYEGALPLVDVEGLPLTNLRVAYYYLEYGTNLAFLSRPNENYCKEAFSVLQEVRAAYPDDPILMDIVEDSEGICRRLEGGFSPEATTTPEVTLTPEPEQMTTEQSP